MTSKIGTTHSPELPNHIPTHSQWLPGQGIGAWFCIDVTSDRNRFNIKRFAPSGELDCDRLFEIEGNGLVFDIVKTYHFTYISHCSQCRILQNEVIFTFNYIAT